MVRRKAGWRWWAASVALILWGGSLHRAYQNLAMPAFGPAEQATGALLALLTRYVLYLVAGGLAWFALTRVMKPRRGSQRRVPAKRPTASSG